MLNRRVTKIKPLLAHIYEPHRVSFPLYAQPKLNGVRALYQAGNFQSRDELPWSPGILNHIADSLAQVFPPHVILDGELYVHGWPLQRINGAVTPVRTHQREDTCLVEYHIFDTVDFTKSFADRWNSLPLGIQLPSVSFVHTVELSNLAQLNAFYAEQVSLGYEGIMCRLGDCPYTVPHQSWNGIWQVPNTRVRKLSDKSNRTWHLLKRKSWTDDDFLIIGVEEGDGKYTQKTGALVCQTVAGRSFTVGSGLSDADREAYWSNSPAGRKAKVQYLCLSSDGIPLNPTLLAVL